MRVTDTRCIRLGARRAEPSRCQPFPKTWEFSIATSGLEGPAPTAGLPLDQESLPPLPRPETCLYFARTEGGSANGNHEPYASGPLRPRLADPDGEVGREIRALGPWSGEAMRASRDPCSRSRPLAADPGWLRHGARPATRN